MNDERRLVHAMNLQCSERAQQFDTFLREEFAIAHGSRGALALKDVDAWDGSMLVRRIRGRETDTVLELDIVIGEDVDVQDAIDVTHRVLEIGTDETADG